MRPTRKMAIFHTVSVALILGPRQEHAYVKMLRGQIWLLVICNARSRRSLFRFWLSQGRQGLQIVIEEIDRWDGWWRLPADDAGATQVGGVRVNVVLHGLLVSLRQDDDGAAPLAHVGIADLVYDGQQLIAPAYSRRSCYKAGQLQL